MSPKRGHERGQGPSPGRADGEFRVVEPFESPSLLARLRTYFLTGVIVTAPITITFFLVWQFLSFLDTHVAGLLPDRYNPETYLPFSLPGLGLLIMLAFLTVVGMLTAGLAGRTLVRLGERLLSRMPVVRSVYGTLKQIFETILAQKSRSFREVVLIEYPRRGLGAIGFVTGPTRGEVQARSDEELVNVFLPTTPNPTSGFLLFVPKSDLIHLDMTIEEGIKLVISGGIVTPSMEEERETPSVLAGAQIGDRAIPLEQSQQAAESPPALAAEPRVEPQKPRRVVAGRRE
jgi:uncharacterized membrane protein